MCEHWTIHQSHTPAGRPCPACLPLAFLSTPRIHPHTCRPPVPSSMLPMNRLCERKKFWLRGFVISKRMPCKEEEEAVRERVGGRKTKCRMHALVAWKTLHGCDGTRPLGGAWISQGCGHGGGSPAQPRGLWLTSNVSGLSAMRVSRWMSSYLIAGGRSR